ncbi:MAG: amidohydrolase [Lautropia sp.]
MAPTSETPAALSSPATPPPQQRPSFLAQPSTPRFGLPPGACDTHVHVFGPAARFPFADSRPYTPADAPKEALFALHRQMGIERCVIVQSGIHGFDNSAAEDAIAAQHGNYVGIALLPLTVPDAELHRLDAAGFRGVRFNYMHHLGSAPPIADVIAFARRLEPIGWHLQIHPDPGLIAELAPSLRASPVPVVIDHMGRVDAGLGLDQPAFVALRVLLGDPKIHVKVSGSERSSRLGPPYRDAVPIAQALVDAFPAQVLWGTDWPHPNVPGGPPDDGLLVDLIAEMAPAAVQRQALLVDNPARLYRFTDTRAAGA